MYERVEKAKENRTLANSVTQKKSNGRQGFEFVDNRPESIVQRKMQALANDSISQPIQKKENNTGLPDKLKTGMENLSGMSLDDVKVHRNSDKPAQLQAHAYAQGTDIHLGSGQEKHLPHEAWHVVQQKQGRVQPTAQMKNKVDVNDDSQLEKEADVMGEKVLSTSAPGDTAQKVKKTDSLTSDSQQRKVVQLGRKGFRPGGRNFSSGGKKPNKHSNFQHNKRQTEAVGTFNSRVPKPTDFKLKYASVYQTNVLMTFEPLTAPLGVLINLIAGHNVNQLIQLYQTGATTAQIGTLLGVDTNGGNLLGLINAAPAAPTRAAQLVTLVTALTGKGTVPEVTALLSAVLGAGGNIPQATALLAAAPGGAGTSNDLTALVGAQAGKGAIGHLLGLLTNSLALGPATIAQTNALLVAAPPGAGTSIALSLLMLASPGKGTILDVTLLLTSTLATGGAIMDARGLLMASPPGGGTALALNGLVGSLAGKGTIPHLTLMLTNTIARGGSIAVANALLIAAPPGPTTANNLATLLNDLAGKGTIPQLQVLLATAIGQGATITQTNALLAASPVHPWTVVRLNALLPTIVGRGTMAQTAILIGNQIGKGDLTHLRALIVAAAGVPTVQLDAMLNAAPVGAGTTQQLTLLTGAIAGRGTIPNATVLLGNLAGKGTLAHLVAYINALPAGANINQSNALLLAGPAAAATVQNLTGLLGAIVGKGNVPAARNLVTHVFGKGTIPNLTAFVTALPFGAAITAQADALLQAAPPGGATTTALTALVTALPGKGSIPNVRLFLNGVLARGGTIADATALLTLAPVAGGAGTALALRTLMNSLAGKGTVAHAIAMFTACFARLATLTQTDALLQAGPVAAGTANELTALATTLNGKGTVPQVTALLTAAIAMGGSITDTDALLAAAPAGAGTSNRLTAIMGVIAGKGTVPNTTALVTAVAANGTLDQIQNMITACPAGGTAITDMTTAVLRNPVANTPNRIVALLVALHTATLVRFNNMIATLNHFHHALAPGGVPVIIMKWTAGVAHAQSARFNNWAHVLTRHTYENFNFGTAAFEQGFYPDGNGYVGLNGIIGPLLNGLTNGEIANINAGTNVNKGGYRIGGGGASHWIPTIFPTIAPAMSQKVYQNEAAALNNLR